MINLGKYLERDIIDCSNAEYVIIKIKYNDNDVETLDNANYSMYNGLYPEDIVYDHSDDISLKYLNDINFTSFCINYFNAAIDDFIVELPNKQDFRQGYLFTFIKKK